MDPGAVYAVVLTQANVSNAPGKLHAQPPLPPTTPPSLLSVLRTGVWVRVRGVRFAWRSFPNGLYQKKAKIDFGVS